MAEMPQTSHSMGTARMSGLVLKTGGPLMISLLINSLYNFVDSIFVSRVSEDALTALSLAAPVQILMSAMGLGIAVGLNAVISKALGAQDKEKVERTASAALVLAFLHGFWWLFWKFWRWKYTSNGSPAEMKLL